MSIVHNFNFVACCWFLVVAIRETATTILSFWEKLTPMPGNLVSI